MNWIEKLIECLRKYGVIPPPAPEPPVDPPEPEEPPPPVVIEPPPVVDGEWKVGPEVFRATQGFRIVGMLCPDDEHLIITTSRMFKPPYHSEIHIKKAGNPWHGAGLPYETIGQPWLHNGVVYFPAEHNPDGILAWAKGRGIHRTGVKSPGRWFLAGYGPLGFSNDSYSHRRFRDNPTAFGIRASFSDTIPHKGVVRKVTGHGDQLVCSMNFADKTGVWFDDQERFVEGDQVCVEVHAGILYAGRGADFSQDKHNGDGTIEHWTGDGWKFDWMEDSDGTHQMHSDNVNHVMWIAWDAPQRIGYLDAPHHVEMISYPLHSQDKQSSFGCAVTTSPSGRVFWGHTPGRQGVVHEVVRG